MKTEQKIFMRKLKMKKELQKKKRNWINIINIYPLKNDYVYLKINKILFNIYI